MNRIFRIKDILYGIRKYLGTIIGTTLAGLLVGIMIYGVKTFTSTNDVTYKIFASFSVSTVNSSGDFVNGMKSPGSGDFNLASDLVSPIAYICRSELVCRAVVEKVNIKGLTTKQVQSHLSLSQYSSTSIVEINLLWPSAEEGIVIMEAVLSQLPDAIRQILNIGEIQLIEGPVTTTITTSVGFTVVILMAGFGFVLGMLYCFSQLYMHPTLIEIKDVADLFELNMLSIVSEEPAFEQFMADNLITNRAELPQNMRDSFTALAHILEHQVDEAAYSLFVTSSIRGEGKTVVTANLGWELAALDKRVLMIDFDLISPSLGGFYMDNISYEHTVNAVYFDDVSIYDAIVEITPKLHLLPARVDNRQIGIDRFAKKLVSDMETRYDIVLIDTPPIGESAQTLYLSSVSTNCLYVMRYDFAWCDAIEESLEKLRKTNTVIHGAVVNRVPSMKSLLSDRFGSAPGDAEKGKKGLLDQLKKHKRPALVQAEDDVDDDDDLEDDDDPEDDDIVETEKPIEPVKPQPKVEAPVKRQTKIQDPVKRQPKVQESDKQQPRVPSSVKRRAHGDAVREEDETSRRNTSARKVPEKRPKPDTETAKKIAPEPQPSKTARKPLQEADTWISLQGYTDADDWDADDTPSSVRSTSDWDDSDDI